jgi:dTDP-4-amino-4,6-dideoxygalactose transaminase
LVLFTSQLTDLTHRRHALLTGRAAAGIFAALVALGLRGQVVGIPANTCYIVLWAVLRAGCTPLLLDIAPATGSLPAHPQLYGHTLAAIVPCHLYGIPMPMAALCAWAAARGIIVIEDAALALGATVDGKPAGAWGDISVLSFGMGKIVDHGVGGAVLTDDARLSAEVARVLDTMPLWDDHLIDLTNQWNALYWALHQYDDRNSRLPSLYPALYEIYAQLVTYRLGSAEWGGLETRLLGIDADRAGRLALAAEYDALLPMLNFNTIPRSDGATLWKYPLLVDAPRRDDLLAALWGAGIHDSTRWYPSLQTMCAALCPDVPQPPTPYADSFAAHIINLELSQSSLQSLRAAVSRLP